MGNYISGVPRRLSLELARRGFAALSVNTRMANFALVYGGGLLHQVPRDLDAWLALARRRGWRRIVLAGYSMGANSVAHYQALRRPPEVQGLCMIAASASLPNSCRRRWEHNGARPTYDQVERRARQVLGPDPERGGRDEIFVVRRGAGPSDDPADAEVWTYRTWWFARGPEASHAVSVERVRHAGVPLLLIEPGAEPLLPAADGEELARAAAAGGSPSVRREVLAGCDAALWDRVPEASAALAAWLEDMLPPTGAGNGEGAPGARRSTLHRRLVSLTAEDGLEHDALLYVDERRARERERRTGRRTAVVHLHGNQGNFLVGSLRFFPGPLAHAGVPVLTLDTRLGNVSQLFGGGLFEDALLDVGAGARWLAGQGYDQLVVSGYSLGAVLAVRFAADADPSLLGGLVGLGTSWSLPETTRRRMGANDSRPSYAEAARRAEHADGPGEPDDIMVIERAYGSRPDPRHAGVYTDRTWWHSRGPRAGAAMPFRHLPRVRAPVLLVQGLADALVEPAEAARLAQAARDAGNPDVEVAMIDGVGHSLAGAEHTVVTTVVRWLSGLTSRDARGYAARR
jgi:alpha-beta hydrolase superfamily lysophospholipase